MSGELETGRIGAVQRVPSGLGLRAAWSTPPSSLGFVAIEWGAGPGQAIERPQRRLRAAGSLRSCRVCSAAGVLVQDPDVTLRHAAARRAPRGARGRARRAVPASVRPALPGRVTRARAAAGPRGRRRARRAGRCRTASSCSSRPRRRRSRRRLTWLPRSSSTTRPHAPACSTTPATWRSRAISRRRSRLRVSAATCATSTSRTSPGRDAAAVWRWRYAGLDGGDGRIGARSCAALAAAPLPRPVVDRPPRRRADARAAAHRERSPAAARRGGLRPPRRSPSRHAVRGAAASQLSAWTGASRW